MVMAKAFRRKTQGNKYEERPIRILGVSKRW